MMRILSWSQGLGCDKVQAPDFNTFVSSGQCSSSAARLPYPANGVKRKRSPSCDVQTQELFVETSLSTPVSQAGQDCQSSSPQMNQSQSITTPSSAQTSVTSTPIVASDDKMDALKPNGEAPPRAPRFQDPELRLDAMRQTISSQLSLEILLKHKELRLIDQEIAKCQVALEQLRRCTEIPYPATQHPSLMVSEGKGSAVRRSSSRYPAESPAPWGVTEGPYTRHYAKWLLPDRRFDGGEPEMFSQQPVTNINSCGRSTRGHHVDLGSKGLLSRSQRAGNLKSLPAGYGQPKEKPTGPMILKRKSDNTMVKLVCPDCARHDFGSAQGFINHCRIGHSRSFASHDAAAEACGEPVEYNANGTVKGVEPAPTPVVTTPSTTNVHPLVRSAKLLSRTPATSPTNASSSFTFAKSSQTSRKTSQNSVSPDFQGSSQTPHLSELIMAKGLGLDLQNLVTEVKKKFEHEEDDDAHEIDLDSPIPAKSGRHPHVAGSKRPVDTINQSSMRILGGKSMVNISSVLAARNNSYPGSLDSPTTDSPQAPSLVDDDEELDPQSPPSSDETDETDVHFAIHDDEHGDRDIPLGNGHLVTTPATCSQSGTTVPQAQHPVKRVLEPSACAQHDPFVNNGSMPEESDCKRRKIG